MTEHEAFRRALADLGDDVAAPPAHLAGAARGRAGSLVRRRYAAATVAGAVALGAVAAVLTLPGSGGPSRIVAASPSGDPTPTAGETAGPAATASASASTSPAPSAATSPTAGTATSRPPAVAPPAPKVTLRVVSGGRTGEDTVVEAHVTDPAGSLAAYNFSFGVEDPARVDEAWRWFYGNAQRVYGFGEVDSRAKHCDGGDLRPPADQRLTMTRRFRVPGTYTAWVKVQTRSCGGFKDQGGAYRLGGTHTAVATLTYTVTGGLWPNGPKAPTATTAFRRSHWEAREGQMVDDGPGLQVDASDGDGDIREVRVDWGDGTVETVAHKPREGDAGEYNDCEQPVEFAGTGQVVVARPDHEYAQPGTYTVTVTVVGASCDGSGRQEATTSATWAWPPPP